MSLHIYMFCNFKPKINSQFFMEKPTCHTYISSKYSDWMV
jgi:hypothetical protein